MSILEIIITLVIITVVFAGIFGLIRQGTQRTYRGGDETLATIYASDLIEVVRGAPYDAFFFNGEELGMSLEEVFEHRIPQGHDLEAYDERFNIVVDVMQAGEMPPAIMKRVRVTVQWADKLQPEVKRAVILTTFYPPPR